MGNFVRTFTDEKTRSNEAMVRMIAAEAMAGRAPFYGPVALSVMAVMIPPASWTKRRREAARWVTGKPDCDNVLKLIGDSLNRLCWLDDAQIAVAQIARRYTLDEAERVIVEIRELNDAVVLSDRNSAGLIMLEAG